MHCSHVGENTQPEAGRWKSPAARLLRKLRKPGWVLQEMLNVSIPTAINAEIHKGEQTDR